MRLLTVSVPGEAGVMVSTGGKRGPRRASHHAPVVVLSPPRSFSSVVTAMLGRHPDLYGFPELGLFTADTVGGLAAAGGQPGTGATGLESARPGLVQAVAELCWGGQGPAELAEAAAWLRVHRSVSTLDVYDRLLDEIAPLRGVEKSPGTLLRAGALDRVTRGYPRARYLHLTRHPVTALRSLEGQFLYWRAVRPARPRAGQARGAAMARPAAAGPPLRGAGAAARQELRVQCTAIWLVAHRRALALAARLPGGRVLRVRGEDLLADAPGALARVARWLGIGDDAAALAEMRHPERSPYARAVVRGQPGGLDRTFTGAPQLRPPAPAPPGDAVLPAGWELSDTLVSRIRSTAAALGYGLTGA